ncbi:dipeptide ABC transporter ATP-binding protein [Williamsia sterculiae]|uniref:Peptide/nickel transport system ATP-binding protein n=1 Tax=Williamsia sterculiae TaxID=1344003 RepID=A0A1N7F416_9NOCA|nr:ABC transporter ATP-binding protein [Williamsia sterculiae]SIR94972.1 peptide/nickel transport system ATP-binding protein [Williamsia sterculiae]
MSETSHPVGTANHDKPLLEVSDLSVAFGDSEAVSGVNLTIYPGQTVAIVGESGSGKTTTANAVLNLLPGSGRVTAGSISFDGTDLTTASKKQVDALRGSAIGLVPQDPMSNLNPLWKIGFQVREALEANNVAKGAAAKKRAAELLTEAGMRDAEARMNQYPHEFSGGMRQRALIAIGLSCRPKLLVADEPTSALDVTVQRQILDHLDSLTAELGTSVLLITHDLGLAAERASHLVVMYRGKVVESGPALDILRNPQHEYTRRLVSAAPSLASERLSAADVRAEVVEHATEVADAEASDDARRELLVVDHLHKEFPIRGSVPWKTKTLLAVNDVSFAIRRGTTTAIVGESGSGKSTVAQMVLGLLPPTKGDVRFDGTDVRSFKGKGALAFRRRVQPIFQNPYGSIDPLFSIYRVIEEPLRIHGIGSTKEREARVRDLLEKVSLPSSVMKRFPNELSGGQRQRVAIARALALEPELIVCDEAVSALDVLVQAQILGLLNELQADLGLTYLFITHDLAVVKQIADNVVVMEQGAVVEYADTDSVFDNPTQDYTRRLLDAIPGRSLLGAG